MNKEFIPYEQALAIKQLGFDEPCLKYWNGIGEYFDQKDWFNWNQSKKFVSIPLYQQAFRFFREKHGCGYSIGRNNHVVIHIAIAGNITTFVIEKNKSYEQAELECLKKLIELVKNN